MASQLNNQRAPVWACLAGLLALMSACTSPQYRAPVEDRAGRPAAEVKPPPGAENAGKPGYVTVKPGDTLTRIALDAGQSWRDVARWNNLDRPDMIEVGQVLRVVSPPSEAVVAVRPVAPAKVESRPLDKPPAPIGASASGSSTPSSGSTVTGPTPPPTTPTPSTATPSPSATTGVAPASAGPAATSGGAATAASADEVSWGWPAKGSIGATFEEPRMKGVAIVGQAGDPVVAAADGRVVYVGSSVRGYGNLVIVKHNATFLTAYGHNKAVLVKEDQVVRKGQRIADMGSSDAERVQLHFEIRRNGVPIDPMKLLPAR